MHNDGDSTRRISTSRRALWYTTTKIKREKGISNDYGVYLNASDYNI